MTASSAALFTHPALAVRRSPRHGWGVFTDEPLRAGVMIEECPFIALPHSQPLALDEKLLAYVFMWPERQPRATIVPMGKAMIYNHAYPPNLRWRADEQRRLMVFFTVRALAAGEELCVNYGAGYWRHRVEVLADQVVEARRRLDRDRALLAAARQHGRLDPARLAHSERLFSRRAAEVAALEAEHAAAHRELDLLAGATRREPPT